MNVDSTESITELSGDTRDGSDVDSIENLAQSDVGEVSHDCDLQESLAIINGFSHALKSSFDELKDQYSDVLEQKHGESITTSSDRLITLEADCRICLSRLCSSVGQLKQRLEVGGVLRDSTPD